MDIEKLIEQLNDFNENHIAVLCGSGQCACGYLCDKDDCIVVRAATALSTFQAENAQLRESRDHWKRLAHELSEGVNGKDADHERLQAENEKLRAELEKVMRERDAAVERLREWEKFDIYLLAHNFLIPEKWRGIKED